MKPTSANGKFGLVVAKEPLSDALPPLRCRTNVFTDKLKTSDRCHEKIDIPYVPQVATCSVKELRIPLARPEVKRRPLHQRKYPSNLDIFPLEDALPPINPKPRSYNSKIVNMRPDHFKIMPETKPTYDEYVYGTGPYALRPQPPPGPRPSNLYLHPTRGSGQARHQQAYNPLN